MATHATRAAEQALREATGIQDISLPKLASLLSSNMTYDFLGPSVITVTSIWAATVQYLSKIYGEEKATSMLTRFFETGQLQ
ncbi:MAG TPA: hypothetical protein VEA59_00365 [Patescibacteria group bacterium]|nr:hypothetical protein [Patescibacteria group bacterium]